MKKKKKIMKNKYGKKRKKKKSKTVCNKNKYFKQLKKHREAVREYYLDSANKIQGVVSLALINLIIFKGFRIKNLKCLEWLKVNFIKCSYILIIVAIIVFIWGIQKYIKNSNRINKDDILQIINVIILGGSTIFPYYYKGYSDRITKVFALVLLIIVSVDIIYNLIVKEIDKIDKVDIYIVFNAIMIYLGAAFKRDNLDYSFLLIASVVVLISILVFILRLKNQGIDSRNIFFEIFSISIILWGILCKFNFININIIVFITIIFTIVFIHKANTKKIDGQKFLNLSDKSNNVYNSITLLSYLVNIVNSNHTGARGILNCATFTVIWYGYYIDRKRAKNLIKTDKKLRKNYNKQYGK